MATLGKPAVGDLLRIPAFPTNGVGHHETNSLLYKFVFHFFLCCREFLRDVFSLYSISGTTKILHALFWEF